MNPQQTQNPANSAPAFQPPLPPPPFPNAPSPQSNFSQNPFPSNPQPTTQTPTPGPSLNPQIPTPSPTSPQSAPASSYPSQNMPLAPVNNSTFPAQQDNPSSTQSTLLISELRDGLIIMKDGSFRAVIACKSINYDLMSEPERDGIEYGYRGVLNSLEFPIQILVRSQRIDIAPYLERLAEIRRNNDNMLLGVLMDDYINFIDQVSQEANIMDKSFFVIVPFYSSADLEKASTQSKNIFSLFFETKTTEITRIDRNTYDKAVTEVNNRVQAVISGLFNIGIHSVRLNTKELAELFYNFNNPDTAVREPFIDFNKMSTIYTKKGEPQKQAKPSM